MRQINAISGYLLLALSIFALTDCASLSAASKNQKRNVEVGVASYYAHKFHGRATASGEIYDENRLTAAHPLLPFGTLVSVTNLSNHKSVVVRINDRGPKIKNRIIDLSFVAARQLGFVQAGLAKVKVEIVKKNRP